MKLSGTIGQYWLWRRDAFKRGKKNQKSDSFPVFTGRDFVDNYQSQIIFYRYLHIHLVYLIFDLPLGTLVSWTREQKQKDYSL